MNLELLIYLANICDTADIILITILIIGLLILIISMIVHIAYRSELDEDKISICKLNFFKWWRPSFIIYIICLFLKIFIPSANTIYAMVGVDLSQQVYTNVVSSELGKKIYKLIDQKLDEELNKGK